MRPTDTASGEYGMTSLAGQSNKPLELTGALAQARAPAAQRRVMRLS